MATNEIAKLAEIDGHLQLLTAAFNSSVSGIVITDWLQPDNVIIYCNKAFEEMTGYAQEEILGRNCRFLQEDDREQTGRYKLQEAIANGNDCNVELANYRKDGTIFYNELFISPVKNRDGIVTHFIGIQNDVTIRKQKEASLRLEMASAKKLQQHKDEFISAASHELKTPMTSLKATLQLVNLITADSPVVNEKLFKLTKSAERHAAKLKRIIDELLNSTELINGELTLHKSKFSLAEVIEGCCSHISLYGKHHIKKTGNHFVEIYADQRGIDQALTNLVDNAAKYSPDDSEIVIDVNKFQDMIKVSVTDQGRGIAEDDIPHLFNRYYRAAANQEHDAGLGLGLYIAAEFIRRHGGEIV